MAFDFTQKNKLWPKLKKAYDRQLAITQKRFYLDKSHTNIWIVEELLAAFPSARFIALNRNPYSTISSMLRHHTVSKRQHKWKDYPVPNPFLGITETNIDSYPNFSFAARCALRWRSHHERTNSLKKSYPNALQIIEYEVLMEDPDRVLSELQSFLKLQQPIQTPEIKIESKDKWRDNLSPQDIQDIKEVTGVEPPANA
jgi:hypothetical protein